jgi:antirestriction protein
MSKIYEPRIFIGTPLAPACGQWVDLPEDDDALEEIRADIAGDCDYIISDKEDLPGIGEHGDLQEINDYARWLVDEKPEPDVIEALSDAGLDLDEIRRKYKDGDYTIVEGYDEWDLAANYLEELGGVENALSPDCIATYFDYEKFGRGLIIDGFHQYNGHWINLY